MIWRTNLPLPILFHHVKILNTPLALRIASTKKCSQFKFMLFWQEKREKISCAHDFYFIKANIIRLMRTYHLSSLKNLFWYLSSWKQCAKPSLHWPWISRNEKGFYKIPFPCKEVFKTGFTITKITETKNWF